MAGTETRTGKGKAAYLCGVPGDRCTGGTANVSHGLRPSVRRMHGSRLQAMRCYQLWLERTGYTRLSSRMFRAPNNGPVLVLNRESQFGDRLRPGKAGRSMPTIHTSGTVV